MDRRDLLKLSAAVAAASAAGRHTRADEPATQPAGHGHDIPKAKHPLEVVMLVYPGFTALDLVGPQTVLSSLYMRGHPAPKLVWKDTDPVMTDTLFAVKPTHAFADVPKDVGVLFVPGGGAGTLKAMEDPDVVAFLADRGRRAKWVTSVCTGSLVLGAAGLLTGYKATSHWLTREFLPAFGADPVDARVVADRNRMTGAGVTAGLDFALRLLAELTDERWAKAVALNAEYAPEPPFACGTPAQAGPELTAELRSHYGEFLPKAKAACERAAAKLSAR